MTGMSKLVDERINAIKEQSEELEKLREELEARESELKLREMAVNGELAPIEERKHALNKEIDEATSELERLKAERTESISNFGAEMDRLHTEKTSESDAQAKQLRKDVEILADMKSEMEAQRDKLKSEISEAEQRKEQEFRRINQEKDAHMLRMRAEREAEQKELARDHAMAIAKLNQQKKDIEDEVAAAEHHKTIEYNKIQAELSRYKIAQLAELDAKKEESLAEIEKARADSMRQLRDQEVERTEEIAKLRRDWDKELMGFVAKKQHVQDEIELLQYEYDKTKAENLAKFEKSRADELKTLTAFREEIKAKHEDDHAAHMDELDKKAATIRTKHQEERNVLEKAIADAENDRAKILGEINLLHAKYETTKTENEAAAEIIRSEKLQEIEEMRIQKLLEMDAACMEARSMKEIEQNAHIEAFAARENALRKRLEEERAEVEVSISECNARKNSILREIEAMRARHEQAVAENDAVLEAHKAERTKEIDELRLQKLREVEAVRQERMEALEQAYFERVDELEKSRNDKLETVRKALLEAEQEMDAIKQNRHTLSREVEVQNSELNRLKEEAATVQKQAVLDKQIELEKMTSEKLAEVDEICAGKLAQVLQDEKDIAERCKSADEAYQARAATIADEVRALEQQKKAAEEDFNNCRSMQTAEIEGLAKLKLEKMKEIESYMEAYKEERLAQIQRELEQKLNENQHSADELKALNEDYRRRETELNERAYTLDAERNSYFFKEKRFLEEQNDIKNMLQGELDVHRKEMALFSDTRDQHLGILQEQIKTYAKELADYQEEAKDAGGKTKKELLSTIEFLESRIAGLQKDLENKPSAAYLAEMEDRISGLMSLEQENKKQSLRIANLEKERLHWQVSINEISKLTEEKMLLEQKLSQK